jgi:hypothetical protein
MWTAIVPSWGGFGPDGARKLSPSAVEASAFSSETAGQEAVFRVIVDQTQSFAVGVGRFRVATEVAEKLGPRCG